MNAATMNDLVKEYLISEEVLGENYYQLLSVDMHVTDGGQCWYCKIGDPNHPYYADTHTVTISDVLLYINNKVSK